MELRHLRYFVALAKERHYGRAAGRLAVTQPTLTASIKQLEATLGVALFERGGKAVTLTEAGASLLAEGEAILTETHRAVDAVISAGEARSGWLRLGFSGSMIYAGVPQFVSAFRTAHKNISTTLVEYSRSEQIQALTRSEIDAGFIDAATLPHDLEGVLIYEDAYVCCVSTDHPVAKKSEVNLSDLSEEYFMMFSRDISAENYDRVISICTNAGFDPKIRNAARQWLSLAWVADGLGVALVPARLADTGITGVRFIPLSPPSPVRSHGYLVWKPKRQSPELQAFVSMVREMAAKSAETLS